MLKSWHPIDRQINPEVEFVRRRKGEFRLNQEVSKVAIISISDLKSECYESVLDAENLSSEELALKGGTDTAPGTSAPAYDYVVTPPTPRRRLVKIADSVRVVYY